MRALLPVGGLLFALGCSSYDPRLIRVDGTPAPSASTRPTRPTPTSTATVTPAPTTPPTIASAPLPELFANAPVRAERARPIAGGTLLVTADGTTAVAADPDRAAIFLVDLAARSVRSVPVEAGDEPGRLAEGPPGTVYAVARGSGVVLAVDLASASIKARIAACPAPRGIAYDASAGRLHVACRSGLLVGIDAASASVIERIDVEEDLRDVIVRGDKLLVTRFRSSEVLVVGTGGGIEERLRPLSLNAFSPQVLYRAFDRPDGSMLLAHQIESDGALGTGFGAYYGGGCFGGGVVQQALTVLPAAGVTTAPVTRTLPGLAGPTDLAISRDGTRMALIATGNSWIVKQELPTLYVDAIDATGMPPASFSTSPCGGAASQARYTAGEPVAVAFDANGRYLIQSREPALLELEGDIFISLSPDSRFDSGLATFYLNTGGNISCASCHPEGGDDGHVWSFSAFGYRRSQSLAGGVSPTAPFHWSGDIPSFEALFTEVMMGRMALPVQPPAEHVTSLLGWLDTLPPEMPADHLDASAVARGRQLFTQTGCADCHSGDSFGDGRLHDVGTGGEFVTPSLLGVANRTPLFHDGCARTLRDRFGICGGDQHGDVDGLSEPQIDDFVAYLRTL